MKGPTEHENEGQADPRFAGLIGLIVILALAIIAVVLVHALGRQSNIEDCLMSGRTNCAPIAVPRDR